MSAQRPRPLRKRGEKRRNEKEIVKNRGPPRPVKRGRKSTMTEYEKGRPKKGAAKKKFNGKAKWGKLKQK